MNKQQYLSISAVTKYIKRKFDFDPHLQDIYLMGEISNFTSHSSGTLYFTLKDEKSKISAIMFKANNSNLAFKPENGMKVLVRGEITVFERDGKYQIYVREMKPDGVGDLFLAYEQLKKQLSKEGLFSEQYKKPLPKFPNTIGVVTSKTGAVVRDIITTIKRRYPICKIILIPASVQGDQAAPSIVKAIRQAHETKQNIDVLIVGRGGGSIEELWAFNEEIVAREIFNATIPIISAVGHETDFTIADLVADLRAPTPTAAAEIAVPHISEIFEKIRNNENKLQLEIKRKILTLREQLVRLDKSYAFRYPQQMYEQKLELVDQLTDRLNRIGNLIYEQHRIKISELERRLYLNHPGKLLKDNTELLLQKNKLLQTSMTKIQTKKQNEFAVAIAKLDALNPLNIMARGYSVAYKENNEIVKSITTIKAEDRITINVSDGKIKCRVLNVEEGEIVG